MKRSQRLCAAIGVLVALEVAPALLSRMQPDTGWLLYSAGRMLDGARLYVDVVEVNPPLIVWLDSIPVAASRLLGVSEATVFGFLVLLLSLVSVLASGYLLRQTLPERPALQDALLVGIAFVLFPLTREDFGQREHLFLAFVLPYVLLTGLRAMGGALPATRAVAVGVSAGIGIALKPYFVLVWLTLEVGLWIARGRRRPALRPESVTVVLVGAVYLVAVLIWAPAYFGIVRLMAQPYLVFLSNSLLVTAFLGDGAVLPLFAVLAAMATRQTARSRPLWTVLGWAIVGLWVAAVLQQKGWRYHYYPAFSLALLLLILVTLDARRPLGGQAAQLFASVAAAVLIALGVQTTWACLVQSVHPYRPAYDVDPDMHRLLPVVQRAASGGSMAVLSWSIASAFPLANYAGVPVASRFPSLWSIGGIYWSRVRGQAPLRYNDRAEMGPLERYVNDAVIEDLQVGRPNVILVLRPGPDRFRWGLRRIDFLAYFLRDPRFAALFQRYAYMEQLGEYWLFERLPEQAPPSMPWKHPAIRAAGAPDPGLAGGTEPLTGRQILAGLAFALLLWATWSRERRATAR